MVKRKSKKTIIIEKHNLMPKHFVCSEKEKENVLSNYSATTKEMPKIAITDAALTNLKVKLGDMIRIERKDALTGKTNFYRVVADE